MEEWGVGGTLLLTFPLIQYFSSQISHFLLIVLIDSPRSLGKFNRRNQLLALSVEQIGVKPKVPSPPAPDVYNMITSRARCSLREPNTSKKVVPRHNINVVDATLTSAPEQNQSPLVPGLVRLKEDQTLDDILAPLGRNGWWKEWADWWSVTHRLAVRERRETRERKRGKRADARFEAKLGYSLSGQ